MVQIHSPRPFYFPLSYGLRVQLPGALQHVKLVRLVQQLWMNPSNETKNWAQLPAGAQFLNVIESVFSGMARGIIHNSDYCSVEAAKDAIDRYYAGGTNTFEYARKEQGVRFGDKNGSRVNFTRVIIAKIPFIAGERPCETEHYPRMTSLQDELAGPVKIASLMLMAGVMSAATGRQNFCTMSLEAAGSPAQPSRAVGRWSTRWRTCRRDLP